MAAEVLGLLSIVMPLKRRASDTPGEPTPKRGTLKERILSTVVAAIIGAAAGMPAAYITVQLMKRDIQQLKENQKALQSEVREHDRDLTRVKCRVQLDDCGYLKP